MKKFLALLLIVLVGFTFVGCGDSKSALANSIEANVSRLSKLLDENKDIKEEDISIKELYSSNSSASTINAKSQKNNSNKTNNSRVAGSKQNIVNLGKKIKNTPRPTGKTQIVKKSDNINISNNITNQRLTNGSYKPRKVSNVNYNNSGFQNYLSKIEDLYLMMNDAIYANNECNNLKSEIKQNCNTIRGLCKDLKKDKIKLTDSQVQTCHDLLAGLNKNTNTLNNTKNDVQTECNAVKRMNVNPNSNLEQISTKYIKLINCLDEKTTCYSNILSILTQLKCTISGNCGSEKVMNAPKTEKSLENVPRTLPYFPEEDIERTKTENQNSKINNIKKYPTSKDKDESVTLNKNKKTNKTTKKNNLNTFKNSSIKPNVGLNKNLKENNTKNETSKKDNTNLINNNQTNGTNGTVTNGTNTGLVNGPVVNGGVAPIVNGGNILPNGYGIHNYENGVTNPYRNTDTYKLPTGRRVVNGTYNGTYNNIVYPEVASSTPLESETRKNFKTFN